MVGIKIATEQWDTDLAATVLCSPGIGPQGTYPGAVQILPTAVNGLKVIRPKGTQNRGWSEKTWGEGIQGAEVEDEEVIISVKQPAKSCKRESQRGRSNLRRHLKTEGSTNIGKGKDSGPCQKNRGQRNKVNNAERRKDRHDSS